MRYVYSAPLPRGEVTIPPSCPGQFRLQPSIHSVLSKCASRFQDPSPLMGVIGDNAGTNCFCSEGAQACSLGLALLPAPGRRRSPETLKSRRGDGSFCEILGACVVQTRGVSLPSLRTAIASLTTELPSPLQGFGYCGLSVTWGWQTAPAPGYMPLPLQGILFCGSVKTQRVRCAKTYALCI